MSELADDFRAMREHRRRQNEKRRDRNVEWIERFRQDNPDSEVEEITPYQFRIDGFLDIYPTNQKFHNIETGKRGFYHTIAQIVKQESGE